MNGAADLLMDLAEIRAANPQEGTSLWAELRHCDVQHVDVILHKLLRAKSPAVVSLSLEALSNIGAKRAARSVLDIVMGSSDVDLRRKAARTIWRLGDLRTVAQMRGQTDESVWTYGVQYGLTYVTDQEEFDKLLRRALTMPDRWMAVRAMGLQKVTDYTPAILHELSSADPNVRGCAALALARAGGSQQRLSDAYGEAHKPFERALTALALLVSGGADQYSNLETQLRKDLTDGFPSFVFEIQADVLTTLENSGHSDASDLAQAWAPLYTNAARRLVAMGPPRHPHDELG
jgi:hypothetical protein